MATTAPRQPLLRRVPPVGLVLAGITSVQFGSALAATIFDRVGASGAVLLRLASASLVLGLLWRPRISHLNRRELGLAALFGVVLAAMNLSFYQALARIPLGIAVTLEFVGPLTVAVVGSRRRLDLLWVVLAAVGILSLTRGSTHSLSALGVGFALLAGAFWGCYIIVNARVGQAFSGGDGLALAMITATLVAVPFGVASGGSQLFTLHDLAIGSAVGVLSSVIPYSFELEALRSISTRVFGVLMSLEPAMAALAGAIVLGQSLGSRALIGIALVVAASVGAARRSGEAPLDR